MNRVFLCGFQWTAGDREGGDNFDAGSADGGGSSIF
jgi:hypothetical protein